MPGESSAESLFADGLESRTVCDGTGTGGKRELDCRRLPGCSCAGHFKCLTAVTGRCVRTEGHHRKVHVFSFFFAGVYVMIPKKNGNRTRAVPGTLFPLRCRKFQRSSLNSGQYPTAMQITLKGKEIFPPVPAERKKMVKRVVAVMLCAVLLCSAFGTPASATDDIGISIRGANRDLVPEYVHYDPTEVLEKCTKLETEDWTGKEQQALGLYDEVLEEIHRIDANCTVIMIAKDEDVTDKTVSEEYLYSQSIYKDISDAFLKACHALTNGPCAAAFQKHIRPLDFEYMKQYKPMTEEEKKAGDRLDELGLEYETLMTSGLKDVKGSINGKEYSMEDITNGPAFEELELEQRIELYLDLAGKLNDKAGEIFLEMIPLRNQIAKINGYQNFAEYADRECYGRDFGSEEASAFCQGVKDFFAERGRYLEMPDLPEEELPVSTVLDKVGTICEGISPVLDESFSYLKTNGLYSIGNEETRVEGAYSTRISNVPGNAFIYGYMYGYSYDLTILIHELGHFTNFHNTKPYECYSSQFEVAEIHSTGLELLTADKYNRIFDDNDAQKIMAYLLCNGFDSIQQGCLYDEWQRQLYTHPEMTLEQINNLFYQLSLEYGITETYGMEYQWMYVSHNFTSPMYYISYAVSAMTALDLWALAQTDYAGAVKVWEDFLTVAEPYSYFETMERNHLSPFTDARAVDQTLSQAFDRYIDLTYSDDIDFGDAFSPDGVNDEILEAILDFFGLWEQFFEEMDTGSPQQMPEAV